MESLALLLIFPLVWPFIAKAIWKLEITAQEIGINVLVGVVVVMLGWFGGQYAQTMDREIINGEIIRKESHRVSCEHSYSCNCKETCSTRADGTRSCSQSCDTCYDHSYDVNHTLYSNVGDIDIDRVDRQGVITPPRFSKAAIGDPVAQSQRYTNYVKGAPNSLFNALAEQKAFEKYKGSIPEYPIQIVDYHYANRVLAVAGAVVPDADLWNKQLALALRKLGPAKEANAVVVFTGNADPAYALALRSAWLGSKKNDIVLVIGTPVYPAIAWARVISWTDNQLFKVELSDAIQELQTATPEAVLGLLSEHTFKSYQRKHMKEFEYLKWEIEPPVWLMWCLFIGSILVSVGTSWAMSRNSIRVYSGGRQFSFRGR